MIAEQFMSVEECPPSIRQTLVDCLKQNDIEAHPSATRPTRTDTVGCVSISNPFAGNCRCSSRLPIWRPLQLTLLMRLLKPMSWRNKPRLPDVRPNGRHENATDLSAHSRPPENYVGPSKAAWLATGHAGRAGD